MKIIEVKENDYQITIYPDHEYFVVNDIVYNHETGRHVGRGRKIYLEVVKWR